MTATPFPFFSNYTFSREDGFVNIFKRWVNHYNYVVPFWGTMDGSHKLRPIPNTPIWFCHRQEVGFVHFSLIQCLPCPMLKSAYEYLSLLRSSLTKHPISLSIQGWLRWLHLMWKTFSTEISFVRSKLRLWCRFQITPNLKVTFDNWQWIKNIFLLQTRRWSFGSWLVMRLSTVFHKSVCTAIRISSVTLFCHPTVTTPCPAHGIRLCVCGIWLQERQLADSKIIPRCEEVLLFCLFVKHETRCVGGTFGILPFPKYGQYAGGFR